MIVKIRTNLAGGMLGVLLSIALWGVIPAQIKVRQTVDSVVNAQSVPKMVAGLVFAMSMVLFFQSLVLKKEDFVELKLKDELRSFLFIGILLAYVFCISIAGFLIATMAMSAVVLLYLGSRKWQHYLVCELITVFVYLSFTYILGVQLP